MAQSGRPPTYDSLWDTRLRSSKMERQATHAVEMGWWRRSAKTLQLLINGLTFQVGTRSKMSGYATYRELAIKAKIMSNSVSTSTAVSSIIVGSYRHTLAASMAAGTSNGLPLITSTC